MQLENHMERDLIIQFVPLFPCLLRSSSIRKGHCLLAPLHSGIITSITYKYVHGMWDGGSLFLGFGLRSAKIFFLHSSSFHWNALQSITVGTKGIWKERREKTVGSGENETKFTTVSKPHVSIWNIRITNWTSHFFRFSIKRASRA